MLRPTVTLDEAAQVVGIAIAAAVEGRGPAHVLIDGDRGTRKTHSRCAWSRAKQRSGASERRDNMLAFGLPSLYPRQ
jgi:hypothetical protein